MDEQHVQNIKWAIYELMGTVSIDEVMSNHQLVESFARLDRLLRRIGCPQHSAMVQHKQRKLS